MEDATLLSLLRRLGTPLGWATGGRPGSAPRTLRRAPQQQQQQSSAVHLAPVSVAGDRWMLYEKNDSSDLSCCGDFCFASSAPVVAHVSDGVGHNFRGPFQNTVAKLGRAWKNFHQDLSGGDSTVLIDEQKLVDRLNQLSLELESVGKGSTLSLAWLVHNRDDDDDDEEVPIRAASNSFTLKTVNVGDSTILLRRGRQEWELVQGYNDKSSRNKLPDDFSADCIVETKSIQTNDIIVGLTDGVLDVLKATAQSNESIFAKLHKVVGTSSNANGVLGRIQEFTRANVDAVEDPDDCSCFVIVVAGTP